MVDPATRLRLDFFPDALRALSRTTVVDVAGVPLRVVTAQDILDHKLALLSGASVESPIDRKQYEDRGFPLASKRAILDILGYV